MCESSITTPPNVIACDFDDRSKKKKDRDPQREAALSKAIADDTDPGKKNALLFWRDSVLCRLFPRRDVPQRIAWQLARLPKAFLPFVQTADGRVLLGPANEVHALVSFTPRVKDTCASTYVEGERIVPPQENAAVLEEYS